MLLRRYLYTKAKSASFSSESGFSSRGAAEALFGRGAHLIF
jgi:hypothetical protein